MDSKATSDTQGGDRPVGLGEAATGVAERAEAEATEAGRKVREQARAAAEEQKARGARQIEGVARALHSAAGELEPQLPQVARYVHDAAGSLETASTSLQERSVEDLLGAFGRFARDQPAVLFGAAVVGGLALSRFLKSSGEGRPGPDRLAGD